MAVDPAAWRSSCSGKGEKPLALSVALMAWVEIGKGGPGSLQENPAQTPLQAHRMNWLVQVGAGNTFTNSWVQHFQ
jgi:hypothetical protein